MRLFSRTSNHWLLACALYGATMMSAYGKEPLALFTHELPPLNFTEKEKISGLSVDVVRELMRRTRIEASITMEPWARAYTTVSSQPDTGVFFIMRTPEREPLFQWVGPIVTLTADFFAREGSSIELRSLDDARRVKSIYVHRGSYQANALQRLGFQNLVQANSPEEAVRLLALSNKDEAITLLTSLTVQPLLLKRGMAHDSMKPLFTVSRQQGYIAFSKSTSVATVNKFQKALDAAKLDGVFAKIYAKWLPADTPPGLKAEPGTPL
jgi:polar amino acid transport system substrate-binding protein